MTVRSELTGEGGGEALSLALDSGGLDSSLIWQCHLPFIYLIIYLYEELENIVLHSTIVPHLQILICLKTTCEYDS